MTGYTPASPASSAGGTNPLAIASLITGIAAWVIGGLGSCVAVLLFAPFTICTWIIYFGGSIGAAVAGHMARSQIRQSSGAQTGGGLALTGIVLGWTGLALSCLGPVFIIGLLALLGPAVGDVFSDILLTVTAQAP
jgi:hypothetical protein